MQRFIATLLRLCLIALLLSGNPNAEVFAVTICIIINLLVTLAIFAAFKKFEKVNREEKPMMFISAPVTLALVAALVMSGHHFVGVWLFLIFGVGLLVRFTPKK